MYHINIFLFFNIYIIIIKYFKYISYAYISIQSRPPGTALASPGSKQYE